MSRTRHGPGDLAAELDATAREHAGRIRRMCITRSNSALYQITGHTLLDGEPETRDAEVFAGVGFAAVPSDAEDAGETEAIVAFVGGPGNPIIIAQRQERARQIVAADLKADETQLHGAIGTGGTIIRIKRDGTVEIRTAGGNAVALAKQADLQTLRNHVAGLLVGGSGSAVVVCPGVGTGTTVLKGE